MTFSVSIPRCKADMEKRYERHEWLPAINVKCYKAPKYTSARIAAHFGCDEVTAERAAQFAYDSAVEQFWEQALDSLNFAMLGDERASHLKPCGLKDGPYTIEADGRSGGWLIAKGIGTVEAMDGPTFQKWRKFCRFIDAEMKYLASWDYGRNMIEANEWAPKAETSKANRANARAAPMDRLAKAALAIHGELDGRGWEAEKVIERIAGHLRAAGLAIAEAN